MNTDTENVVILIHAQVIKFQWTNTFHRMLHHVSRIKLINYLIN